MRINNLMLSFFFILLFIIFPSKKLMAAGPICDTIFRSTNVGCSDLSLSNTSGGSYPLLFDAFNFNPSALPTFPTPVGIEGYYSNKKVNIALIKGMQNLGLGASTKNSNTTFFSGVENYKTALDNSNGNYNSSNLDRYLNLGTALNLIKIPSIGNLPLGLSYKYNPETKKWTFQPGVEIRTANLSIGISYNMETPDRYSDGYYDLQEEIKTTSANINLKIINFLLGYSLISAKNTTRYYQLNSNTQVTSNASSVNTHIFSSTFVYNSLSLSAAYRYQNDTRLQGQYTFNDYQTSHLLVGAAYKTERLELGTFYNYLLDNDVSVLAKIFF